LTRLPTAAIQRGAAGTFVYVVRDDLTVAVTPVQIGTTQGEITAIDRGVSPGEKVVVDGADRLRHGAKVELATREPAAPDTGGRDTRGEQEGGKRQSGARI